MRCVILLVSGNQAAAAPLSDGSLMQAQDQSSDVTTSTSYQGGSAHSPQRDNGFRGGHVEASGPGYMSAAMTGGINGDYHSSDSHSRPNSGGAA